MTDCTHYWILESPHGPTVQGECKLCGKTDSFPSVSDLDLRNPNSRRSGYALRHWRFNSPERIEEQL